MQAVLPQRNHTGDKPQGFQGEEEAWRRMEGKGQVLQGSVQGWGVSVAGGRQKLNMSTGVNLILQKKNLKFHHKLTFMAAMSLS